jgi:hypothetical protein
MVHYAVKIEGAEYLSEDRIVEHEAFASANNQSVLEDISGISV